VTSTDPKLLQSPFRAGIKLDPYQLEPLRKALRLPRVSLFIADDVGLGKTIEAGLIARELLLRKKAREIVVSCPPSLAASGTRALPTNRTGTGAGAFHCPALSGGGTATVPAATPERVPSPSNTRAWQAVELRRRHLPGRVFR